jgi:hypothetical protein
VLGRNGELVAYAQEKPSRLAATRFQLLYPFNLGIGSK